ncbi:membrane protein [Bacillus glycinifermentans]|uniref:DUF805 domain-containing protein n=1 Tax=Bacillus glycinifermentans TaxID=1664069 RepID=UPI0006542F09|nr:DUF805 domain-containing protein [Bacillus glycinifermentans]KMM63189.1 membrane protein [Bacillus glycinifermentans]MEC0493570.1 DUF805 domain-containing protein [Bacillus glycinifermentans]MEC0541697.1 DUF805 domain-containing protein [Bacillus glycinifermentans]UOY90338.1 DUF805 domain-containing protein [Bacillus glycinifermentans]
MKWYWKGLKNYANFEGRARRKEYWMFHLFNGIISFLLLILSLIIVGLFIAELLGEGSYQAGYVVGYGGGLLAYILILIYQLAVFVPSLAVNVRRLHDIGKSGWWILIGLIPFAGAIILLIFYCQDSETTDNQYGPNPKANLN